jgi:hypothetical protein
MHPIQDSFLESFSYVLQIDLHFICTPMWTKKDYSCKKWVLQATEHHPVEPRERHLSSWCMGPRSSFPRKSPWALFVSRHTTKPRMTISDVRISTWSMSKDGNLLLKMHATGRRSGATTSGSCRGKRSKWMNWSSSGCLTRRA